MGIIVWGNGAAFLVYIWNFISLFLNKYMAKGKEFLSTVKCLHNVEIIEKYIPSWVMKFYSQLNSFGREPTTSDIPVSHSVDIPTEEFSN